MIHALRNCSDSDPDCEDQVCSHTTLYCTRARTIVAARGPFGFPPINQNDGAGDPDGPPEDFDFYVLWQNLNRVYATRTVDATVTCADGVHHLYTLVNTFSVPESVPSGGNIDFPVTYNEDGCIIATPNTSSSFCFSDSGVNQMVYPGIDSSPPIPPVEGLTTRTYDDGAGSTVTFVLSGEVGLGSSLSDVVGAVTDYDFTVHPWGDALGILWNDYPGILPGHCVDTATTDFSMYDGTEVTPLVSAGSPVYASSIVLNWNGEGSVYFSATRSQVNYTGPYVIVSFVWRENIGGGVILTDPECIYEGLATGLVDIPMPDWDIESTVSHSPWFDYAGLYAIPGTYPMGRINVFYAQCDCTLWDALPTKPTSL